MKKNVIVVLLNIVLFQSLYSQNNFKIAGSVSADFNFDGISDQAIIIHDTTAIIPIFKVEVILINQFEERQKIIENELNFKELANHKVEISLEEIGYVDDLFVFSFKINNKVHSYHFKYTDRDFDMLYFGIYEVFKGKILLTEGDLRKGILIFREKDLNTKV